MDGRVGLYFQWYRDIIHILSMNISICVIPLFLIWCHPLTNSQLSYERKRQERIVIMVIRSGGEGVNKNNVLIDINMINGRGELIMNYRR